MPCAIASLYPFTAVDASERTNVRCAARNASSTGRVASTLAAMIADWLVCDRLLKLAMPSGSVSLASLEIAIAGHETSFQVSRNVITATVASAGRASGSTIVQRIPQREQPSIHAA